MCDLRFGLGISFQEMALSLQSPGNENAVYPPDKGSEYVQMIQFPRAGQPDDLYIRRV